MDRCKICFDEFSKKEKITLTCSHSFCKDCLNKDLQPKIKAFQVDDFIIICPELNCGRPINHYDLQMILPKTIFDQYNQLKTSAFQPKEKNEKTISCPKCNILSIIHSESQYFSCPVCTIRYCAQEDCLGVWQLHSGLSCIEFQMKFRRKELNEEEEFKKMAQDNKYKPCPKCGVLIEKTGNCNYVACQSRKCQKKTVFCYICGEVLNEETKKTHYRQNNAFLLCNNAVRKDNPNDQFIAPIEQYPQNPISSQNPYDTSANIYGSRFQQYHPGNPSTHINYDQNPERGGYYVPNVNPQKYIPNESSGDINRQAVILNNGININI